MSTRNSVKIHSDDLAKAAAFVKEITDEFGEPQNVAITTNNTSIGVAVEVTVDVVLKGKYVAIFNRDITDYDTW